jgi:hypothetical protein
LIKKDNKEFHNFHISLNVVDSKGF